MAGNLGKSSRGGRPTDPFMSFLFTVGVESKHGTRVIGGFSDVTGLAAEVEIETLRVGGLNSSEIMLPGATKFPSRLVLKRGLADGAILWNWYLKILRGIIARENVTIDMWSPDHQQQETWTFSEACPVKWTGPELHAGTSAVAFEAIELVHKGFLLPPSQ